MIKLKAGDRIRFIGGDTRRYGDIGVIKYIRKDKIYAVWDPGTASRIKFPEHSQAEIYTWSMYWEKMPNQSPLLDFIREQIRTR